MTRPSSGLMLLATLAAAAGIVWFVLWRVDRQAPRERIGFQDADAPLAMPAEGLPDPRFRFPSAWQAARIPVATRFLSPLGSEHGALAATTRKFASPGPEPDTFHCGDDIDGIGGTNSDLGDPVFAVADGLVVFAGESSPSMGKTVVIAHRKPDQSLWFTLYGHLDRMDVAPGVLIAGGSRIGTVGTADGHHQAHLHFELRSTDGIDPGLVNAPELLSRADPADILPSMHQSTPETLGPSALALAMARTPESWTDLEISGAEKFPGIADPEAGGN